jgi:hypothetical protein
LTRKARIIQVGLLCAAVPVALHRLKAQRVTPAFVREILKDYGNANPITAWPLAKLLHSKLGLKHLEPASNQTELGAILQNTGKETLDLFREFSNTDSIEHITVGQLLPGLEVWRMARSDERTFHYLFLTVPGDNGASVEEYRTDRQGKPVNASQMLPNAPFVTSGFAGMPALFLPSEQRASHFRYLGRQKLRGHATFVVAFAQKAGGRGLVGIFKTSSGISEPMLMQGLAWIDSAKFRIRRMRTDLLAPLPAIGLERETTDIHFRAVRLRKSARTLWLPVDVMVTIGYQGGLFENHHMYSHFKQFHVSTQIKAGG